MRATVSERVPADGDIDRPNIAAPILAVAGLIDGLHLPRPCPACLGAGQLASAAAASFSCPNFRVPLSRTRR